MLQNSFIDQKSQGVLDKMLKDSIIDIIQLETIQEEVRNTGIDVMSALIKSKLISESIIQSYFNGELVPFINLNSTSIDPEIAKKIPKYIAVNNCVVAFAETSKDVSIALVDVGNDSIISMVADYFPGKVINTHRAKETDILAAIDRFYEYNFDITSIIDELEHKEDLESQGTDSSYQSPMIRFVDSILYDAVHKNSSDIHIQPDEFFIRVRYRIDGVIQNQFTFHKKFYQSVIVRTKIISGMNIAESIKPQDGGIEKTILGRKIDFRVSIMPTIFGEGLVIRILDKNLQASKLSQLGLSKDNEDKIRKIINKPEGVMIVTGPTGSGKTTTLYAIMSELTSAEVNMITLEDPVEYHMPMAKQMNVNHAAGIDFANGLRAILRQDPDIILVGEMRDEETAITAMRASMTGHKVFSTLHTNDAPSAINRLLDLKISPHIISSAINGIVAQRLVRKLCNKCKTPHIVSELEYKKYKIKQDKEITVYEAKGCNSCNYTGYKGRSSIMEVIVLDSDLRSLIENGITEHELIKIMKETRKFVPMQIDAIKKVLAGVTSFDEIDRCVNIGES